MCFWPKTKENNIISYITCVGFVTQVLNGGDWTVGCVALHFTRDNVARTVCIRTEASAMQQLSTLNAWVI